ncbi:DEAD/DEAH box helicase [Neptunicella sp. SCSIO 80796]|uniref:DEAD/DEAH box helicase n=1 Tax=Neptunicella plasticusilytica TaxID=3117012 RepID=UPI003A4E10CD
MQFSDLPLDHRILNFLNRKGFADATEIQSLAIPHALIGKDLIASSKTGSGKTLAFLIPALQRVLKTKALSQRDPRVLVLAPTRELAKQVFLQLRAMIEGLPLKAALILGGENFNDQVKTLRRHPQFVVGTAGRIADHVKDRSLFLNGLELLIMDEADRMLDLGFAEELKAINRMADHRKRQSLMFSATMDNTELHYLTKTLLKAPQRISIGEANAPHQDIEQRFYLSDHIEHKEQLLKALLAQTPFQQVILFTATRVDSERLAKLLQEWGHKSVGLSGELSQSQRSNIMNEFSRGHHQILVTTDVASRGLDLLHVSLVINFDLPKLADEYVHRIGRTGRAGNKGTAMSLVGPKDWRSFMAIKTFLQQHIEFSQVDGLAAKFKGLAPAKSLNPKHKPGKNAPVKAPRSKNKPVKRIKSAQGVDVGDAPMLRKKTKLIDRDED